MNTIKTFFTSLIVCTIAFVGFLEPTYAVLNTGIGGDGIAGQAAAGAGYSQTDEFTLSMIIGLVVQFVFGFF